MNTLSTGTVPNRNKKYTGHSSQPEQEMQWAHFPARTGGTRTLGADPSRNRNKWGTVLNRNKGHLGKTFPRNIIQDDNCYQEEHRTHGPHFLTKNKPHFLI
jgi:hypothetical protein